MKLIAKKGSHLEKQIKNDYEKKMRTQEEALSFIEERTGIKPSEIGYIWMFGYTCVFDSQLLSFESEENIDKKLFVRNTIDKCFKINTRTKEGRNLHEDFCYVFNKKYLDYTPYQKFGILFKDGTTCYWWEPYKEGDKYMIICGNSMMDKLKDVDNAQYTILP